jgi:Flp pilus assembly protein TadG
MRYRKQHGQNLVETALAIPILFLFLLGVVDIGRVFNNYMVLANATRQGAREAMRLACWETTTGRNYYRTAIEDAVLAEIPDTLQDAVYQGDALARSDITVTPDLSTRCPAPGETLRVAITYAFPTFMNGVPLLGGGAVNLGDLTLSPFTEVKVYSRQPQ